MENPYRSITVSNEDIELKYYKFKVLSKYPFTPTYLIARRLNTDKNTVMHQKWMQSNGIFIGLNPNLVRILNNVETIIVVLGCFICSHCWASDRANTHWTVCRGQSVNMSHCPFAIENLKHFGYFQSERYPSSHPFLLVQVYYSYKTFFIHMSIFPGSRCKEVEQARIHTNVFTVPAWRGVIAHASLQIYSNVTHLFDEFPLSMPIRDAHPAHRG